MLPSRGQIHDNYIRAVNERDRWDRNLNAAVEELRELKKAEITICAEQNI